jgi:hypothetical protein
VDSVVTAGDFLDAGAVLVGYRAGKCGDSAHMIARSSLWSSVRSTAKVQKKRIMACLAAGENGCGTWLPRYLEFPARGYTVRFRECAREEPLAECQPIRTSQRPRQESAQTRRKTAHATTAYVREIYKCERRR